MNCQAQPSYGTVTAVPATTFAFWRGGTVAAPDFAVVGTELNADATPDVVQVELYKGSGPFRGGIVPGSYPLAGDDLQYSTCGICVAIRADVINGTGSSSDYLATGGTIVVNSVSPDLSVTLTNVTFEHVTIDEMGAGLSTPVNDGCESGVTAATIAGPSVPVPMN